MVFGNVFDNLMTVLIIGGLVWLLYRRFVGKKTNLSLKEFVGLKENKGEEGNMYGKGKF